jgi:cell wall-associated NlpC family hydrolase
MAERNHVRLTTSLPALGLATLIAVAAITVQPTPVAATDPSPSPSPTATATPTATPSPEATPGADPSPTPTASGDPSPSTDPSPSADPSPTADPTDPPATDPTDPPVTDPTDPATTVVTTTTTLTRAERIRLRYVKAMRIALRQRHDQYVSGAVGPNRFDCSGLVRYTYRKASLSRRLGGGHSARAMYAWALRHHKLRRHHPKVGDVVVWGHGRHVGIYIGRGKAISALNPRQDIRVTRLHALGDPLTGFIRTRP